MNPDYATPPGDTLRELIREKGMNRKTLAAKLGLSVHWVDRLVSGEPRKSYLNIDAALKLESIFGMDAHFWLSLEMNYRLALARRAINQKTQTKT